METNYLEFDKAVPDTGSRVLSNHCIVHDQLSCPVWISTRTAGLYEYVRVHSMAHRAAVGDMLDDVDGASGDSFGTFCAK